MNASSHFSILTVILTLLFMSHPLRASKAPADSTFLFYISGDTRIEGQPLSTLYGVYNVVEHLESVFSIENNPQAARYHAVILFDGYHPNDYPTLSVFKYGKKLKEHSIDYVLDSGKPLSLDMGHPETFRVFLNKIKNANLVSRYYHLGFNGHGAGWQGYGFDTNDGRLTPRWTQDSVDIIKENQEDLRKIEGLIPPSATKEQIQEISERVFQERREARKKLRDAHRPSYLSVKELSETLSAFLSSPLPNGNPRFDVIHFTACIMESIELAYEFSDFANAMSGSSLSTPFAGPDIISELAESKNFGETLKDLIWGRKYFLQYEQKYDFLRRDHSYTPSEILEELLHSVIYLQAQDPSSVNVTWKPYPSGDTRDLDELYVQNSEVYYSLIASM